MESFLWSILTILFKFFPAGDNATSPLFEDFCGTMGLFDFPCSCITALLLADSQCGPCRHHLTRPNMGSPSSRVRSFHACTGSPIARSLKMPRDSGISSVAFRHFRRRRRSEPLRKNSRGSIPGLHVPLSTLQAHPYGNAHMTRGQYGLLILHCTALASATPYQLSGASEKDPTLSPIPIYCALPTPKYVYTRIDRGGTELDNPIRHKGKSR